MFEIPRISLKKSNNTEFGVKKQGEDYIFTCGFDVKNSLVLVISDMKDEIERSWPINEYRYAGNVYSVVVSGLNMDEFRYYYLCDGTQFSDPYAKRRGYKRSYGLTYSDAFSEDISKSVKSHFALDEYDFSNDERPMHSQSDVIAYQLHVRGFTKHPSSKVKGKGCFLGITEKIPYFQELNINQIELMPAYDFYEFDVKEEAKINHPAYTTDTTLNKDGERVKNCPEEKLNYWGYKSGNYFSPKYEYSYSDDAVKEFKDMVSALHKAKIEVIMQMFFTADTKSSIIIDSLRFWYNEFHVDGFHVMGPRIPSELILNDDILADAKIYINNLNRNDDIIASLSRDRNIIDVNDGFMVSMRRYLKSDADSLNGFVFSNRTNSPVYRTINYLTKYEGFTLNDLVSYEYKHNELNGEDNTDGVDNNYSWNCGIEGKSTKKAVKELRIRQIKNALCLLLLSQGTPMLYMGDEFMNSQNGNNNPYCQDSEISWLNWKLNKSSEELLYFAKMLTAFRKNNKVIHQDEELKNMDYLQTGNPDVSYHQDMAWKSNLNNYLLHIGIMLDGAYAFAADKSQGDTLYIAYNMHWENHLFGLPRLKASQKWELVFSTSDDKEASEIVTDLSKTQENICVFKRSVVVLKAKAKAVKEENK